MISSLLFAAHFFFIALVFVKKYQNDSLWIGVLNAALIIIIFTVLWSTSYSIFPNFISEKGFGRHFTLDDIILTIVSLAETGLYYLIYKDDFVDSENATDK